MTPTSSDVALIVIAKEPVPGRVKTRLSPPCSADECAALATAALRDTLSAVLATPARERVLALEGRPGPWLPRGLRLVAQSKGDLDRRLSAAFGATRGPALLIGMDTPQVTSSMLASAACTLIDGPDAVLGAAMDGGWWALGVRRADTRLFEGVPMSSPRTHERQLAQLRALGYRCAALPRLRDVDRFDDALAVAEAIPASRFAATVRRVADRVLEHVVSG